QEGQLRGGTVWHKSAVAVQYDKTRMMRKKRHHVRKRHGGKATTALVFNHLDTFCNCPPFRAFAWSPSYTLSYCSAMLSLLNKCSTLLLHCTLSIFSTSLNRFTRSSTVSPTTPVSPSDTTSGTAPRLKAMTGAPEASDSASTRPKGSSKAMGQRV